LPAVVSHSHSEAQVTWALWTQTAELLKKHMAGGENPRGLALLSGDGNPMVDDAADSDAIALAWGRLLGRCNYAPRKPGRKPKGYVQPARVNLNRVRQLLFGALRKTGGTWLLNHAGEAVQQMHLAHAPTSVAGRHYTGERDYATLHAALGQNHQELVAAGMFDAEMKPKKAAAAAA
jgi:hypothetical protein